MRHRARASALARASKVEQKERDPVPDATCRLRFDFAWGAAGAALLLLALPVLEACGGSGGGEGACGAGAGPTVQLREFRFVPSSLHVKAGTTPFCLVNSGTMTHDLVVTDQAGKVLGKSDQVQPGGSRRFPITLQPGTYLLLCDLPGHRESGMSGSLTVG